MVSPDNQELYCFYAGKSEYEKKINPDFQGSVIKAIMQPRGAHDALVLSPKPKNSPSIGDLQLLLTVSKQFGKVLDLDELMYAFAQELFKRRIASATGPLTMSMKQMLEKECNERFVVSFLHLANAGMFEQAGRSKHTWKRTFYSKVTR